MLSVSIVLRLNILLRILLVSAQNWRLMMRVKCWFVDERCGEVRPGSESVATTGDRSRRHRRHESPDPRTPHIVTDASLLNQRNLSEKNIFNSVH